MITQLHNENSKQYQAICDYWRLGASRSLNQLLKQYKEAESAPAKTYMVLKRWYTDFEWERRISENIALEQKELEALYQDELVKNTKRRFDVLDSMYDLIKDMTVDTEDISISQATGVLRSFLDSTGRVFNLDAPLKVAQTDPTGKKEYRPNTDLASVLELLDLAKEKS
ncbi:MAG: hypothetical protein WC449_04870 [Candidatus Paceibacterota bacterium]